MNRTPWLIDTDPGVDDALALLMALNAPHIEVSAITIATGNVGLENEVRNALKLLEVCEREVPVFVGCPQPLLYPSENAAYVHGRDGFGDIGYTAPEGRAQPEHAALAMIRLAREHAGTLNMIMLGPLTNLALAVRLDPELPSRVRRLVIMGGAVNGRGNTTVPAEFNIGFDPEAAHIVCSAFPQFDLADWEATLNHEFSLDAFAEWVKVDSPRAKFYDAISAATRRRSAEHRHGRWHSADALAMAMALYPDGVLAAEHRALQIELGGSFSRGATVVDWEGRSGRAPNANILLRYQQARFEALIREALAAR